MDETGARTACVRVDAPGTLLDIVGTGGDDAGTLTRGTRIVLHLKEGAGQLMLQMILFTTSLFVLFLEVQEEENAPVPPKPKAKKEPNQKLRKRKLLRKPKPRIQKLK